MRTILFLTLLLSACATSTPVYTESGKSGYNLTCNGDPGWNKCYELASNACGSKGYTIIQKSNDLEAATNALRQMTIQCN